MDDLTWQQLQTAIGVTGAITLVSGKVVIDPSLITGDTFDSLNDKGVLEFLYKLLGFGQKAQTTINQGLTVGSRLNSFSSATFGAVSQLDDGSARLTATRQITVNITLDQNNPVGLNI
jgi:hypothetical protein